MLETSEVMLLLLILILLINLVTIPVIASNNRTETSYKAPGSIAKRAMHKARHSKGVASVREKSLGDGSGGLDDEGGFGDSLGLTVDSRYQYSITMNCEEVYANLTMKQICTVELMKNDVKSQEGLNRRRRSLDATSPLNRTDLAKIFDLLGCTITYGSEEHRYNESALWDWVFNAMTVGQIKCIDPSGKQKIWKTHGIPLLNFNSLLKETSFPIYVALWVIVSLLAVLLLGFTLASLIRCVKYLCCCYLPCKCCYSTYCERKRRNARGSDDDVEMSSLLSKHADSDDEVVAVKPKREAVNAKSPAAKITAGLKPVVKKARDAAAVVVSPQRQPSNIYARKSSVAYLPITVVCILTCLTSSGVNAYRLTVGLNPERDIFYASDGGEMHSLYLKSRVDHYEVRRHIRIHDCEFEGNYNLLCRMSDHVTCPTATQRGDWRCYITPRGVPVAMIHQHQSFPYFDAWIEHYNTHYGLDIPVDKNGNSLYCNTIPNNIRREYNYTMRRLGDYADVHVVSYDYTEVTLSYRGCDAIVNSKSGIVYDENFQKICGPLFDMSLVPGMSPIYKNIDKLLNINITKAPALSGLYINTGLDVVPNGEHAFCYTDGLEYRWNYNAQERMLDIGRVIKPPPVLELIKSASTRPLLNSAGGECKRAELSSASNELLLHNCQGGLMALDIAIDEKNLMKLERAAVSNVEMLPFEGCNEDWTGIRVKLRISVTKAGVVDVSCDGTSCPSQKLVLPVGSWEAWIGVKHAGEVVMYINDYRRMLTITCSTSTGTASLATIKVVNNIGSYVISPTSTWSTMMTHTKWWIWALVAFGGLFILCIIIPTCLGLGNFIRNITKG